MPTVRPLARVRAVAVALAVLGVLTASLVAGCARPKPPRSPEIPTARPVAQAPTGAAATPAPAAEPPSSAVPSATATSEPQPTPLPPPTDTPLPAPTMTPEPAGRGEATHVVRPGETLSGLATAYDTSVLAIMNRNGIITADRIYAGQVLSIPLGYRPDEPAPVGRVERVVRAGDTLANLARAYRTTVDEIVRANPHLTDPESVPAGTVLSIPVGTVPEMRSHQVQPGETIAGIARRYQVNARELIELNGLTNPNIITPGHVLIIP